MSDAIYLDGFASLPLSPEARDAMLEVWERPGNAGSPNALGERAARIIADARFAVGALIGAFPSEIFFTSGATEANNLALLGVARMVRCAEPTRRRILISAIEHKSIIEPARQLESEGFAVTVVPVTSRGTLNLTALQELATDDVLLASLMLVNNELGTIQPIREAAEIIHAVGGLIHCDAAQAAGKIEIDVLDLDIDYLSLSAHKCYGPMGIGALYISAGAPKPHAQQFGGGQQSGVRPGTEPTPLIAGFGSAARAASAALRSKSNHEMQLLSYLLDELRQNGVRFAIVSGDAPRVPGGVAISIADADGDALCARLASQVAISTGSACTSGQLQASHVLDAIGLSNAEARSIIRLFCNRYNTEGEMRTSARALARAVARSALATGEVHQ